MEAGTDTIRTLHVRDAMHEGVVSCDRDTALSEVARTMVLQRIHCVVVESGSGDRGPAWGVVSDLDLVAGATVRRLDEQTAGGTATGPLVLVRPDASLERAAQLMTEHATAHLLVVDAVSRPVGVLSTLDVARALAPGA